MNRKTLAEQLSNTQARRIKLMLDKGQDYAGEDVLANFKRMSQLCRVLGVNPARSAGDCAMFLELLKIDRYMNLKNKGIAPANESVQDTLMDAQNYWDLAYACDTDK